MRVTFLSEKKQHNDLVLACALISSSRVQQLGYRFRPREGCPSFTTTYSLYLVEGSPDVKPHGEDVGPQAKG